MEPNQTLPTTAKIYTALLTQSGTDAPVATILKNTTGETITPTYDGVGQYILIKTTPFNENKTGIILSTIDCRVYCTVDSGNIVLNTKNYTNTNENNNLYNNLIEIRIYE